MASVRWTPTAQDDFVSIVRWHRLNRGPAVATKIAAAIRAAVRRASRRPLLYAWVGSIYPDLSDQPRKLRRIVTRPPQHTVFYHYDPTEGRVTVLHIRGPGQLTPEQLGR